MNEADRAHLHSKLLRIGRETKEFNYVPSRFLQDVARSDPAELIERYVRDKTMTDGFVRLWQEKRLDLTVENIAWLNRRLFRPDVAREAENRLREAGFDVQAVSRELS
jgi:hypothetical protein